MSIYLNFKRERKMRRREEIDGQKKEINGQDRNKRY